VPAPAAKAVLADHLILKPDHPMLNLKRKDWPKMAGRVGGSFSVSWKVELKCCKYGTTLDALVSNLLYPE